MCQQNQWYFIDEIEGAESEYDSAVARKGREICEPLKKIDGARFFWRPMEVYL